ncbi:MAG: HEAT repeat domain-containing protein, partial [Dehalococcoidia bacterium]|nr:HEAT repeat domain-containing protein [Dehalococcoidia bacterium]
SGCSSCWRGDEQVPQHALPGDRPVWPRDRVVDVRHIALDLSLDIEGKRVSGTATHTVCPLNDGLGSVPFDAVEMTIEAVRLNGEPAKFTHDGRELCVDLRSEQGRGTELEIAVDYSATPRLGLYFVGPDQEYPEKPVQVWSQSQDEDSRYWFPCYDHPSQKQTSEVRVRVPGSWFALSNGTLVEERDNEDGTKTFHWKQERPHSTYLMTVAAGEFTRIDASREGLTIDYFVEAKDVEDGERTFKNTPAMIEMFERVTGVAYPWAKYSQVVVRDFVFGGMENTSATTMTENILVDRKAGKDYTSDPLISHELAHQWFGDLLTCRDWSHGWLNESFATYSEVLWYEEQYGADETRQYIIDTMNDYVDEQYRRPIVTNVFRDPIDIFDRHLYEKGAMVLHTLRGVLGDDAFFRSVRRYCSENLDRNVVTQDLIDAIASETGRNLEWFFDQWVFRPGHPELKVSWSWDDDAKLATVRVKQTQDTKDGVPLYRVPVTIDFRTGRGRPQAFRVEVAEAEHTFVFPLAAKPDLCRFDPYNRVLKELEFDKSTAELRLQLGDDDDVWGRATAAKALGKKGGREATEVLAEAVLRDRFWGVQAAAAKALGEIRGSSARDALVSALQVRHPKARRAVVAALGEFRGDESVLTSLVPLSRRDASWFVEAEANRSIGKLRLPGSFDAILVNFDRRSFREVVRVGCIDGLVELRDEHGFEALTRAARYGEPFQARGPAVSALAKLGEFFPERKRQLGEQIAAFTRDPDFRVRVAAANALKTLKDATQIPALERMAEAELDGRAVRTARSAVLELRKGAQTDEEVKQLRQDLEKLRDENTRLRERLDRVEAQADSSPR